jgi:hypothetical protein
LRLVEVGGDFGAVRTVEPGASFDLSGQDNVGTFGPYAEWEGAVVLVPMSRYVFLSVTCGCCGEVVIRRSRRGVRLLCSVGPGRGLEVDIRGELTDS